MQGQSHCSDGAWKKLRLASTYELLCTVSETSTTLMLKPLNFEPEDIVLFALTRQKVPGQVGLGGHPFWSQTDITS